MEWLLILLAVGGVWYWLISNSQKTRSRTTITERKTVQTEDGSVTFERISEVDERKMALMNESAKLYRERLSRGQEYTPAPTKSNPPLPPHITVMQSPPPKKDESPSQAWINHQRQRRQVNQGQYISSATTRSSPPVQPRAQTTKICGCCAKTLPHTRFRANSNQPDGLTQWCSSCLDQRREPGAYKVCPRCKQRRMKSSFPANSKRPDGLTKWCKFCLRK